MEIPIIPIALLSLRTAFPGLLHAASPDTRFSVYHTRMNPSGIGQIVKYKDLTKA